jgi:hypothetical protein
LLLTQGNDGSKHCEAGTEYEGDGEWVRRLLVNGLAKPLDDAASKVAGDKAQQERYKNEELSALGYELAKADKSAETKK